MAGVIRIGGFSSVTRSLVIPALKITMQKNPKISLQLITKELRELPLLLKSAEVDYILTTKISDSADIESLFLGFEDNYLMQSRSATAEDVYLDHDEKDITTRAYFSQNKMRFKAKNMRYLDDVYGLLDGVKNGFGKAVLPLHLAENESGIEILNRQRRLAVPVYLNFYVQPFYRKIHSVVIDDIRKFFQAKLRQK
jgi:DNA-binding transcriptional LysR family regulator